ncbi:MAG: cytochrome c family protein [Sedimentisphaerales bacterium]|nr:cytochrome c family protein [Sedimentisphaerales bacterium]
MKQLIVCICILVIIASCELSNPAKSPDSQRISIQGDASDSITVFLTGNLLGSLKPCGCSGGQLGGLDRRPAVFNTVPADKRLLIDTGALVENQLKRNQIQKDQDFNKFLTITEAFDYLNYDIVNLTKQDLEIAQNFGLLGNESTYYITPYESVEDIAPGYQNQFTLDGENVNIVTVSFDPDKAPLEYIKEIFPKESDTKSVNILILNTEGDADFNAIVADISQLGVVDCIVCPVNSDEPTVLSKRGEKPLVCAVGRYGRYISSIVIENAPDNTLKLSFNDVPLREEIQQDQYLINLYKIYQDRVKEEGLLGENPRFIHENGLKYVGSKICESEGCHSEQFRHQYEYAVWKENAHAKAYATLVEVGSQYDPECIICHVVGYDYESGFKTLEKTPELINVGCEICHGPGSAHCENPYENKTTPIENIEKQCLQCHTPEHSGDFAGHEEEKIKIIQHWTEPNDVNNVK